MFGKKTAIIISLFFLVFIIFVTLFRLRIQIFVYSLQPCSISFEVDPQYQMYNLRVNDIKQLQSFAQQIGNCQSKQFVIHPQSAGKNQVAVKKVIVKLQSHPQQSTQNNKNRVVFGYYSHVENDVGVLLIAPTNNLEGYQSVDHYFALTITRRLDDLFNNENLKIKDVSEYDNLSKIGVTL